MTIDKKLTEEFVESAVSLLIDRAKGFVEKYEEKDAQIATAALLLTKCGTVIIAAVAESFKLPLDAEEHLLNEVVTDIKDTIKLIRERQNENN